MHRPGSRHRPAAIAGLAALAVVSSVLAPATAPALTEGPRPLVRVQSDRSVGVDDAVAVSVRRVSAAADVVVDWGDGARTTVAVHCSRERAAIAPRRCGTRVAHAYRRAGTYGVSVRWSSSRVASARITVARSGGAMVESGTWEQAMLGRVNALRAEAGVPPLVLCAPLGASAQKYARVMASTDHYGHVGPDGREPWDRIRSEGYEWRTAAENIAAGQSGVESVMSAWRRSPGHLANMTDPGFRHVGFGFARDGSSTYATYWVQHFGDGGDCSP